MSNKKNRTTKWRRFSRSPFATFQSIRREVNIGVLAIAMLLSVELKADDSLVVGLGDVEVLATRVPLDEVRAPRLVTVLTAAEIASAAVQSIPDLLEYSAGVDIRQRGEFGVQTDVSIRGGTFDQITILLNGINISSPQTGHHSADFPVAVQDIERIEVFEGPSARVFGTSAFTGVINIVTRQARKSGAIRLLGGDHGLAGGDLRFRGFSGGYSRSDGATPNSDFSAYRSFFRKDYQKDDLRVGGQFGYSYKQYGANTFYGTASTDQWESNEHYIGSLSAENKYGESLHLSASVNWNRWFDHYQWHKNNPAGENFHRVDAAGGTVNAWFDSRLGRSALGFETRYEGIYSTKLGHALPENKWTSTGGHDKAPDISYTHHADRIHYSAFAEHNILLKDWTISLGVLATHNTRLDSRWRFYPGIDLSYRPTSHWRLFASWNMALRMPTFTDLFYSGTNIEGTQDIKPEKTNDVSIGSRLRKAGWKAEASIFTSHKTDMIDWVIYANEPDRQTYRSGNFSLNNFGAEISLSVFPRELFPSARITKLGIQYAYINEDMKHPRPIISSKYAMEYLRNKVVANFDAQIWKNISLSLAWRWQERTGIYNKPYSLLDGKIVWDLHNINTYLECSNILNQTYFDYSFIPQPKRWAKIGFSYEFN